VWKRKTKNGNKRRKGLSERRNGEEEERETAVQLPTTRNVY
jgi:hypothetical protein